MNYPNPYQGSPAFGLQQQQQVHTPQQQAQLSRQQQQLQQQQQQQHQFPPQFQQQQQHFENPHAQNFQPAAYSPMAMQQQAQQQAQIQAQQQQAFFNPNAFIQSPMGHPPQPQPYGGQMPMHMGGADPAAAAAAAGVMMVPSSDGTMQPGMPQQHPMQQMTLDDGRMFQYAALPQHPDMGLSNQAKPPFSAPSASPSHPAGPFPTPPPQGQHMRQTSNAMPGVPSTQAPIRTPPSKQPSNVSSRASSKAPPSSGPGPAPQGQNMTLAGPTSPKTQRVEQDRVSILLDINRELLQEVMRLRAAGKTGAPNRTASSSTTSPTAEGGKTIPAQGTPSKGEGGKDSETTPSPGAVQRSSQEYVECMRRLQSNLAYLATIADYAHKPNTVIPEYPAIMTPPATLPTLREPYHRLNELFPGAKPVNVPTASHSTKGSVSGGGGVSAGPGPSLMMNTAGSPNRSMP